MKPILLSIFCCISTIVFAQYNYEPSEAHPYGLVNPNASDQLKDFQPLIGQCKCKSTNRNADGSWNDAVNMTWTFKYIMNGMALQDETLKADGKHSGSIRQFNADSSKWYVHYYSSNNAFQKLPSWEGTKRGDSIVLYREQKSPTGNEGFYRLTFYDISDKGYKWIGAWVSLDEKIVYPTWKIICLKEND